MATQKAELPTLAGKRVKTRKRDEKVKYDPKEFSEQLITSLNEAKTLEEISKYLDKAGSEMDYRRYAEQLFDVMITGTMLAPGGKQDPNMTQRADVCVFSCEPTVEAQKEHIQMMTKLVRQRYKYLQKSLQEELGRLVLFLKAFTTEERRSLAIFIGLCLSETLITANVLQGLMTKDTLRNEGLSLEFATILFQAWMTNERGIAHISSSLRKVHMENRLLELLPSTRQTAENFDSHFEREGLSLLVKFRRAQENAALKKVLREEIDELIQQEAGNDEIIDQCRDRMKTTTLTDVDITVMLWRCIMGSVEWNKKEELVAEQALKHLKIYCPLFLPFCEQGTPQLTLLIKMQEYCYDNMNFMKVFHKIVLLFYKNDILTEQAILKWYNESHIPKGKSVFLAQMKKMVDWLLTAEEESDSEPQPTPAEETTAA